MMIQYSSTEDKTKLAKLIECEKCDDYKEEIE